MKGKHDASSGHKQRSKVSLVYSEVNLHQDLQVKKPQCRKSKVFTVKQATSKVQLILLNVKMLKEIQQRCL